MKRSPAILKKMLQKPKLGDEVRLFEEKYVFGRHGNWWRNCYFVTPEQMRDDFEFGHVTF